MAEISRILKPGGVFVATTFLSPIPYFGNNDIRKVCRSNLVWNCTLTILSFDCKWYQVVPIFTTYTSLSGICISTILCHNVQSKCTGVHKARSLMYSICKLQVLKTATRTSTIRYWDEIELKELCGTCGLVDYSQIRRSNFIMLSARKSS